MLDSENQQVAFRAVSTYLDRALGKAALQGGRHDVSRSEAVAIVRQERATKMDAEIPAARAMLSADRAPRPRARVCVRFIRRDASKSGAFGRTSS
jgi:hypothetical protein